MKVVDKLAIKYLLKLEIQCVSRVKSAEWWEGSISSQVVNFGDLVVERLLEVSV